MPVVGLGNDQSRDLMPAGEHILTLKKVEFLQLDDNFAEVNADGTKPKKDTFRWDFVNEASERYAHWTGTKYGNEKAKLTELLDRMVPGITKEQADGLDTDVLLERKFKAIIEHRKSQNTGNPFAYLAYITPLPGQPPLDLSKQAPAAPAAPEPTPSPGAPLPATSAQIRMINSLAPAAAVQVDTAGLTREEAAELILELKGIVQSAHPAHVPQADEFTDRSRKIVQHLVTLGCTTETANKLLVGNVKRGDLESLEAFEVRVLEGEFNVDADADAASVPADPWAESAAA